LDLEYIYGSDTGKEGFEKANRNFSTVNAGLTTSEVNTKAYADTVSATAKNEAVSETKTWTQQNFSNRNLIRNPFQVWQKGEHFSSIVNQYTADGWYGSGSAVAIDKENDSVVGNYMQVETTNYLNTRQYIENAELLAGKTVTLSFYAKLVSGSFVGTIFSRISDHSKEMELTNEWQKITHTYTLPTTVTGNMTINLLEFSTGQGGTNVVYALAQPKFELGSVATSFVPKPYGEELALCQRYYLQYNNSEFPMSYLVTGNTANVVFLVINVPVSMRTVPTIGGNYSFDVRGEGATATLTYSDFTGITRIGSNTFELHFTYTGTSEIFTNNTSNFAVINKGGTLTIDGEI
jgi:hypothetical protein